LLFKLQYLLLGQAEEFLEDIAIVLTKAWGGKAKPPRGLGHLP
jgi:hypothetical protein